MIAALSPATKTVLRVIIWPLPFILTVLMCGGFLLLAAKIAKIEGRSYLRALVIVTIGLGLALAAEFAYSALGLSKWVGIAINHVWFILPMPAIFKTSIPKSLLAYAITFVLTAVAILILAGLWMALGMWPPK